MTKLALLPCLLLTTFLPAQGEVQPVAHYNLKGQGGIRDTLAPEKIDSQAEGAPALTRQGRPKITTNSPEPRHTEYDSVVKFEKPDECYRTPKNLVGGDNFVIETWVYASKADDPGYHAAIANGDGGRGFILGQKNGDWMVLVGGVGDRSIGKVEAKKWTHLALVKASGMVSAWINGKRVANQLPGIGGGSANFSIGATAPNREPFNGWVGEVRYSTFKPGKFDPGSDFLMDSNKLKVIQAAELAKRGKLIRKILKTPSIKVVKGFDEKPAKEDWLLSPPRTVASVQVVPSADQQSAQIMLSNGLVSRTFLVTDNNLGCISLRRSDKDIEFVRAIKPEVRVSIDGKWVNVGGLTGAPDKAFITPAWFDRLQSIPGAFKLSGMTVGPCVKPYEWNPKCNAPKDIAWPANGLRATFQFTGSDHYKGIGVAVSYEIYNGIPVMMKTFQLINKSGKDLTVTRFEGEYLAVQPSTSRNIHVESDYSFALANFRPQSSGLGIHANGGRAAYKDYYLGGGTTRFIRDPDWGSMATLNPAEDIFLDDPENALLLSTPPTGPNWLVKTGDHFDAFRTFEILNDVPTGTERAFLAQRRFYRVLAPQSNEKLLEVHAPYSRDMKTLGPLLDQMHEIGFEQLQAPEHPGSFNYADLSAGNVSSMKAVCDYAKKYNIRVGAYQLVIASQGGWGSKFNCIDPVSKKPGSAFGQSVCAASAWADMYYENMWKMFDQTGMGAYKPDGPFHGDACASTEHAHHRGLEDSQWAQWKWQCKVLAEGQRRNLYLTIPDWYVLNGQTCTGMGYREATDNIDVSLQTVILRQYIFDATYHKTAQMGWINLNTEKLHGGMEKNLDKYERFFFMQLASGAQVWVRGHRLYDGPKSKAMLLKWMAWYKKYYDIIHGDIIHLKRPDGRDIDYYLHVNSKPGAKEKGMLLVFNPLDEEVTRSINVPLYYTGLTDTASIRREEGKATRHTLKRDYSVDIKVTLPANGYTWLIIE
ncbi:MAG: LamG domain-containing protein [Akkermansiaceae bacterium]|nr:LamG domain-containing protein [Akkermansiaceae bacterium]